MLQRELVGASPGPAARGDRGVAAAPARLHHQQHPRADGAAQSDVRGRAVEPAHRHHAHPRLDPPLAAAHESVQFHIICAIIVGHVLVYDSTA